MECSCRARTWSRSPVADRLGNRPVSVVMRYVQHHRVSPCAGNMPTSKTEKKGDLLRSVRIVGLCRRRLTQPARAQVHANTHRVVILDELALDVCLNGPNSAFLSMLLQNSVRMVTHARKGRAPITHCAAQSNSDKCSPGAPPRCQQF